MIPKPISRAAERKQDKRDAQVVHRLAYSVVTSRDKRRCRACGAEANPSALEMTRRGHHHHIRFRSAGGKDDTSNLMLACAVCHADIHAHRLTVTGDANGVLTLERDGKVWTS